MNDFIINDSNFKQFVNPEADGHHRGLVPRDFSKHPVGSYSTGDSFDEIMPLIPRDEWPERCADQAANQSRLSDLQDWEVLDQNGQGFCVTEDSEILTDRGWQPFAEYNGTRSVGTVNQLTGQLEFQFPSKVHRYQYKGEMIYSTNKRVDFGVTPNHRMYLRKWDESKRTLSDRYSFVEARDIGWYSGLMHAPNAQIGTELLEVEIPSDRRYDGDDFFAMLGLIVSDGFSASYDHSGTVTSFASFRPELRDAVLGLADRCGFREQPSRPGVFNRWGSQGLFEWLKAYAYNNSELGAENKRVPEIVKWASPRQIKIFLQWFDDRNRDSSQFYSRSKYLIDDLQELHLRIGKRSTISDRPAKSVEFPANRSGWIHSKPSYVLTVSSTDRLCIDRKKHIEQDTYNGAVYCVTVPNSTMITRRNGSVLISGNCWAYSTTACVMLQRAAQGLPHVRLSPHAVACKIYGFQDRGAWGAVSFDFIAKYGVPSDEKWPQKSMNRRYDVAETWEDAKQYKITEGFIDLNPPHPADADMTFDEVATCLLSRIPVVGDFNWWGHSVCLADLVDLKPGDGQQGLTNPDRWGVRGPNSWTANWGNNGWFVLQGRKAIPDGGCAPRFVTVS